jgi:hypothetical protein
MAPSSALACIKTKGSRLLLSILIRGHCIRFMLVEILVWIILGCVILVGLTACLNFKHAGKDKVEILGHSWASKVTKSWRFFGLGLLFLFFDLHALEILESGAYSWYKRELLKMSAVADNFICTCAHTCAHTHMRTTLLKFSQNQKMHASD